MDYNIQEFLDICIRLVSPTFAELNTDSRIAVAMDYVQNELTMDVDFLEIEEARDLSRKGHEKLGRDLAEIYDMQASDDRDNLFNKFMNRKRMVRMKMPEEINFLANPDGLYKYEFHRGLYPIACLMGNEIMDHFNGIENTNSRVILMARDLFTHPKSNELLQAMEHSGQLRSDSWLNEFKESTEYIDRAKGLLHAMEHHRSQHSTYRPTNKRMKPVEIVGEEGNRLNMIKKTAPIARFLVSK